MNSNRGFSVNSSLTLFWSCSPLASVTISRIRLTVENIQGASRPPTSKDIRPHVIIIIFTVSRGLFHLVSRAVSYQTTSTSLHPPAGGRCRKAMLGVWCPRENGSVHTLSPSPISLMVSVDVAYYSVHRQAKESVQ